MLVRFYLAALSGQSVGGNEEVDCEPELYGKWIRAQSALV